MSKSKHNTVDPSEIISDYGADIARWFMLSDSPPERDMEWTQSGIEGAWRFCQRVWAIADQLPETAPSGYDFSNAGEDAHALRKASHRALDRIAKAIEGFRFNSAVAQIYEWVNALKKAETQNGDALLAARFEAVKLLSQALTPFMPHLAEECWHRVGGDGFVSAARWPEIDTNLLDDEAIILPIQINGKRRGQIEIAKTADATAIKAMALAESNVKRNLEGRTIRKIIVVPGRIVNILAG